METVYLVSDGFGARAVVKAKNLEAAAKTFGGALSADRHHFLVHQEVFREECDKPNLAEFRYYERNGFTLGRRSISDPREYVVFDVKELPLFQPKGS